MNGRLIKTDSNGKIIEVTKMISVNTRGHLITKLSTAGLLIYSTIKLMAELKNLF